MREFELMSENFSHLGRKSVLTSDQIAKPSTILDTFPNPRAGREFVVKFVFPEFTSMCPVTGQPDFATITLEYVPDGLCVEMKSLKLYFLAFRDKGIFYEAVANTVAEDLIGALKPKKLSVVADFAVRGGTAGIVTVRYDSVRGYVNE
ncbi:MAG TPA: preQ(1) synthase [Tepidisphaeraceae bacterium]|nr:preQ(1) synthase [Tepidisphaeraceae bacterium]